MIAGIVERGRWFVRSVSATGRWHAPLALHVSAGTANLDFDPIMPVTCINAQTGAASFFLFFF